jgi:hypothetical protein
LGEIGEVRRDFIELHAGVPASVDGGAVTDFAEHDGIEDVDTENAIDGQEALQSDTDSPADTSVT